MARILVAEDDPSIQLLLQEELRFEGHEVLVTGSGDAAHDLLAHEALDLLILDVMLPERNGFELCQHARSLGFSGSILMLTARAGVVDKVRGLDVGADDYLTKPFELAELSARVRALLRRGGPDPVAGPLKAGPIELDERTRQATVGGRDLDLTKTEWEMLALLVRRAGEVVSRDDFLVGVWEEAYVTDRVVDTHLASLRRKLGPAGARFLVTVRGVGYRLDPSA